MTLQEIATLLTVLWALALIVRRLPWFRPAAGAGCGSCHGCDPAKNVSGATPVPLVQLGLGVPPHSQPKS